jgi:iron complex transport system substrate-binding protein
MNRRTRTFISYFFASLLFVLLDLEVFAGEALPQPAQAAVPRKVVSLAPSVTETLFALGFGDRVVGVTTYCDYPVEAQRLPKIGGFMNPSLEVIVAKKPDVVIGVNTATEPAKAREMERLGLRVTLISVSSLNDILTGIKSIARLMGSPQTGEKLVGKIDADIQAIKKRVGAAPRRRVLLAVGIRPLVVVGGRNFIDELITLAGGENIAGSATQPWLNLPEEYVVAKAPQVIIEAGMGSERQQAGNRWGDLKSVPAVTNGRVYAYPSDKILRPGPRVGEALTELAGLIHPECFTNPSNDRRNGESRCESPKP